ncbi:MarR family winged helix-turn-helix transcriptional regulator [Celeribacter sp. SCSIO 80788]|uniref:MarR family winged helix-turn-helix transcriptional regulator n=1 Tax=Celeribacter sp. SCSIO 80788 TaxID=3117013 RepID=UPI003DA65BFD
MHNAHMSPEMRELHGAVLDIVAVMNRPQQDARMVEAAGVPLDRALFPLLVLVERFGPLPLGELADRVGRDHTTISRQAAKLEQLGLIQRQPGAKDGRVREAVITPAGKAMTDRIDAAREQIMRRTLSDWSEEDVEVLVRLVRRYADAMTMRF